MSLLKAVKPIQDFDPLNDKVALMLKSFTIKKNDGILGKKKRYSEPYILAVTITEKQFKNKEISFATEPYPNIKTDEKKSFLGAGLRIYGPETPGEYIAFNVLVMESENEVRESGKMIKEILDSPSMKTAILPLFSIEPSLAIATQLIISVTELIAEQMEKKKDNKYLLSTGTLLRDIMGTESFPFQVGETISDSNDFVDLEFRVLPIGKNAKHKKTSETKQFE